MNTTQFVPIGATRPKHAGVWRRAQRCFHPAAAIILLGLMFWGFQFFYLHGQSYPGRPITPPIRTIIIAHGVSMTLWLILFTVQPLLIFMGKPRVHMLIGKFGAVIALVIVVLGVMVGVRSAQVTPPDFVLWTLLPRQFLAVPLVAMATFAAFVTAGIIMRRRPQAHRAMMLLGTLATMPAAISRITPLNDLYTGTMLESIFGPYLMTLIVGLFFLAIKWLLERRLDRWYAIGFAIVFFTSVLTMPLARTDVWQSFADLLIGA